MTTVNVTAPVEPLLPTSSATAKADSGMAASAVNTPKQDKAAPVSSESTLTTIMSPAAKAAPFSKAKVDAIKQAIENGEFEINVEKIADGLLQEMIIKPEAPSR